MNLALIRAKLEKFIELLDTHRRLTEKLDSYSDEPHWRETDDAVQRLFPVIEEISARLSDSLHAQLVLPVDGANWRWVHARDSTLRLIGLVDQQAEIADMLGPSGPQLAAERLHPWIWESAVHLWSDGYRREAIQAAATQLELRLRAKLGRSDLSGTELITKGFQDSQHGERVDPGYLTPSASRREP